MGSFYSGVARLCLRQGAWDGSILLREHRFGLIHFFPPFVFALSVSLSLLTQCEFLIRQAAAPHVAEG